MFERYPLLVKRIPLLLVVLLLLAQAGWAQVTSVTGTVVDAQSKEPIPFVSVYFKNAKGVQADSTGHFEISTARDHSQLLFSYIGYKTKTITVKTGTGQTVLVEMELDPARNMNNIVVKSKKRIKYTNKDNPAVELIRNVVSHREGNRPGFYDYLQYEEYEKIELALSRVDDRIMQSKLLKNFLFVFDNKDTSKVPGKTLIPIYLEERVSNNYYRNSPEKLKTIIEAEKKVNFSDLIDSNGISQYLDRLYEKVDIYNNNIQLFSQSFMSPIADLAPSFYMYFIRDTITDPASGVKLVKMYFTPRNSNDLLFRGTMYISLDTNYAVQKLDMTVSPNANLNFIREVFIRQEFERNNSNGKYYITKNGILTEVSISKNNKTNGVYGERTVWYKNHRFNEPQPPTLYDGLARVAKNDFIANRDSFWAVRRHAPLTAAEEKAYRNIDSLRNMKSFKRFIDVTNFLLSGYLTRSRYEIGPAHTFYGWNPVEGFRLRFGGRSTPGLSQRMYFESYAAYGFRDRQWKGFLSMAYSLNNRSVYRFPFQYIKASAQYDIGIPGQESEFVQEDNILLAVKRGKNDKWLYNTIYKLDYVKELLSKLTYSIGIKHWRQEPASNVRFDKPANGSGEVVSFPSVTTSELSLDLRWAPNEKFYQGLVFRTPIITKYPIFNFRYVKGVKGLFNGQYNYDLVNLSMRKRMYMTQLGYNDINIEGGYAFGQLPYPLLFIHRANQTYTLQLNSYNMMNFLEFVSDHYVAVNTDHHLNGFLFNRVPLLKKLDLREVITAKAIVGGVRQENHPGSNKDTYLFPKDKEGRVTTFGLNNRPYLEAGFGIENIFKVLRVEVIKRFTHLDHPNVSEIGVRARVKMAF